MRNVLCRFLCGIIFLTMSFTVLGNIDSIKQTILSCTAPTLSIEGADATNLARFVSENCAEEWSNCKGDYELLSLDRDGQISSGKLNYCGWSDGKHYITLRNLGNGWGMLVVGSSIDQIRKTILSYTNYPHLTISYANADALARFVSSNYLAKWNSCQGGYQFLHYEKYADTPSDGEASYCRWKWDKEHYIALRVFPEEKGWKHWSDN